MWPLTIVESMILIACFAAIILPFAPAIRDWRTLPVAAAGVVLLAVALHAADRLGPKPIHAPEDDPAVSKIRVLGSQGQLEILSTDDFNRRYLGDDQ